MKVSDWFIKEKTSKLDWQSGLLGSGFGHIFWKIASIRLKTLWKPFRCENLNECSRQTAAGDISFAFFYFKVNHSPTPPPAPHFPSCVTFSLSKLWRVVSVSILCLYCTHQNQCSTLTFLFFFFVAWQTHWGGLSKDENDVWIWVHWLYTSGKTTNGSMMSSLTLYPVQAWQQRIFFAGILTN